MKTNVMEIKGEWDLGYVLDWHVLSCEYLGDNEYGRPEFDTVRSDVGEDLFKLKYRSKIKKAPDLADTFVVNLKGKFKKSSLIIPMPSSKTRLVQPLEILAENVSKGLGIPLFKRILIKNGTTPEMKNIGGREERIEALMEVLEINDSIKGEKSWNVLLLDDLYDLGASVTAATRTLRTYKKIDKIYVGAFTRTRIK